jgi:uncharacterized RDD family membrane protein YckC
MMGSAQLETPAHEPLEGASVPSAELPSALKLQVAERVAAHRRRKLGEAQISSAKAGPQHATSQARRANVAAAIAERYAQTPSYRAMLAEQAERAIEEAAAAADIAIRNAHAVAQAQQDLLDELELWNAPQEFSASTTQAGASAVAEPSTVKVPMHPAGAVSVRMPQDALRSKLPIARTNFERDQPAVDGAEVLALDDEIAFRQAPVFEEYDRRAEPPVPLPANLLEFPRQLIAARKARPRIAEGPLLEVSAPRAPQLRIFEVEAEHFAAQPSSAPEVPAVQSFLYLDSEPMRDSHAHTVSSLMGPAILAPETAAISRRLVALGVDTGLVSAATGAFIVTAAKIAGGVPAGINAVITVSAVLTVFWVIYQLLFFTLSHQTPGMRMARIGLCTLSDENPTRKAMRHRVLAQSVALLPFGIGMLWALLDDDRLGWHDRISQMYQRAY